MSIVLWILQGVLAAAFILAGIMKLAQPREKILKRDRMGWVEDVSTANLRSIGLVEFLAGIGLILPPLLGILPWLAPLAAVGLVLTMIGAATVHARRGEPVATNLILLAVAAFVAIGRFTFAPFGA